MVSWKTSIQPAPRAQEEYTVERILDVRADRHTGRYLYYVKWQGYSVDDSTWEPEENLDRAEGLIQAFWAARQGGAGGGGQSQNQSQTQTQN
ncbi:chromo-domain-containing protein [Exidia glandulosa HHB12029]|uniref:Chromo-domain-containing protein n=1 Tax=Exidia glandulosa HHB12029 TaxID=1314781 RepID=A0A165HT31_EXIGL|nr:chromo-domain-containing protein [Exidia glandulosa HHB12029]